MGGNKGGYRIRDEARFGLLEEEEGTRHGGCRSFGQRHGAREVECTTYIPRGDSHEDGDGGYRGAHEEGSVQRWLFLFLFLGVRPAAVGTPAGVRSGQVRSVGEVR